MIQDDKMVQEVLHNCRACIHENDCPLLEFARDAIVDLWDFVEYWKGWPENGDTERSRDCYFRLPNGP